jgi:hypothetical protein
MTTDQQVETAGVMESLANIAYGDLTVTEVIRPAAVLSETDARSVLRILQADDVRAGGHWLTEPGAWRLYEHPWDAASSGSFESASLIGSIQVAFGMPTRFETTIFRASITVTGSRCGYTVTSLCDEVLSFVGLTLATCRRIDIPAPPKPFGWR